MTPVERYVDAVNNADSEALLALFAGDATIASGLGTERGHDEIADFYHDVVFADEMRVKLLSRIQQDNVHVVQLEATSAVREFNANVQTLNLFTLNDDGLVQTLDIYSR